MKFKNLLSLSVMLSCGLVTQAQQVFQEPFDAEQTKAASDVAFYEFINQEEGDDWKISDGGFKGKALFLNNDAGTHFRRARAIVLLTISRVACQVRRQEFL